MQPQVFLYFLYIPAVIASFIVAFILRKYLKFGSFHQIFLVSGICDILHSFVHLWTHWVKVCYPSQLYNDTAHFCTFFDILFSILHFLYNFSMTINRFSATFINYTSLWTPKLVKIYLISMFILSITSCYPIFMEDSEDVINETKTTNYQVIQRIIIAGYILIFETISIILTILTIYRLKKFTTNHEKKLIIVTASHTVIALLIIVYEVSKTLNFTDPISRFLADNRTNIEFFFLSFDFATILIADSRVRLDFWRVFGIRGSFVISVWSSESN